MTGYRNDPQYVRMRNALRIQVKRRGLACWICGRPIDTTLHWKHRMSFTADHVEPIAHGGSMTGELRPAHRSCNSRRGAGRAVVVVPKPRTSIPY